MLVQTITAKKQNQEHFGSANLNLGDVSPDNLCEALQSEWENISSRFYEPYYRSEYKFLLGEKFDGAFESFLRLWALKASQKGLYDANDIIGSVNEVAKMYERRVERLDENDEVVEYDDEAWYNERENANYHSYEEYPLMERYDIWMVFVQDGCKDPYEREDEEDYERAPSPVPSPKPNPIPSPKKGFSYGIF